MICTGLRTASCAAAQMPRGYIGRKLDLEGMRVGCVMSYITIHRWREEVGYHSLQGAVNTSEPLCNTTTGCRRR